MLEQGSPLWHTRFGGDAAPALLTGVAAHAITPLPSLAGAGTALLLGSLAHGSGWPIPRGGSQVITDALVADLRAHGGRVDTDTEATSLSGLPAARAYIFDTTPRTLARVAGARLPDRYRRALEAVVYGNAVAKVDFVLSGPVPWTHPGVAKAGTVHVGGSRGDMVEAESAVAAGRHADRPMALVSDPAVIDETRINADGLRPFWTYAHVPANSTLDATEAITAQVERFAPGFRDVVVASSAIPASRLSEHNANYPGGDIGGGRITLPRVLVGPVNRWDPYSTPVPDVFIASASTPPGPGVHGMGGFYAAKRVLRSVFGIRDLPDLAP
jgi:phytoene dehydrogenase-like protein